MASKMLYVYVFFGSPSEKHDQTIRASSTSLFFVSSINRKDQFLRSLQTQALVWVAFSHTNTNFVFLSHNRPRFTAHTIPCITSYLSVANIFFGLLDP